MAAPAPLTPFLLRLGRAFSVLVALAAILCGARAIRRSATLFEGGLRRVYSPPFLAQLHAVEERVPAGAAVLHLSAEPEYWYSRLWQRTLYPRNTTILVQQPLTRERVRALKAKYGVRYAMSAGDPPWDPGFLWKVDLGPLPSVPGVTWLGELGP
jgi:hypothetical protein